MSTAPLKIITSERMSVAYFIRSFIRYRHLLRLLIWRNINVRYKQATVGLLWVVLQPIISALIFTIIFSHLVKMPADGVPYIVFAYCGTVIWKLFSQGIESASTSILNEENMITQVYFPRWILPLANVGGAFLDFLISLAVLLALACFYGLNPGWHILLFVPAICLVLLLTASAGVSLAMLCCKYRDLWFLVSFLLQILQFVSPVFYSISLFGQNTRFLAYLNPLAGPFELFRLSITGTSHFSPTGFLLSLIVDLMMVLIGFKVIYDMEDELVDVI